MITAIAIIGLAILALILWKPLSVIPLAFAGYFVAVTYIPQYLGYAVNADYLAGKEAMVITLVGDRYFLVIMEGEAEPRLVEVIPDENSKEAGKKAKDGVSIIRFKSHERGADKGESETTNGGATSVETVQPKDSKMLRKTEEQQEE